MLAREGCSVATLDEHPERLDEYVRAGAAAAGIALLDDLEQVDMERLDICVASPGLKASHPWLTALRARGLRPVPEFELGWSRFRGTTVAVSGSNGKSTFVKWCETAINESGRRACACGNYGIPVCDAIQSDPRPDVLFIELSSFQIEQAVSFAPHAAALLNIWPNHLDRHGTMEAYQAIKLRLFEGIESGGAAVVPLPLAEAARRINPGAQWRTFGAGEKADYRCAGGCVFHSGTCLADFSGTLYGNAALEWNAGAGVALLTSLGLYASKLPGALKRMTPLPHRLQRVDSVQGIHFVNDSKATNLAALAAALNSIPSGIHLIAGGEAKESSFNSVKDLLAARVKCVYLIGRDARSLESAWRPVVPCRICGTLDQAVRTAWQQAKSGDTVLLSPACASYDQFKHFEERGNKFVELVGVLRREADHD